MSRTASAFALAFTVLFCSCGGPTEKHQQTPSVQSPSAEGAARAITTVVTVGRFIVFQSVGSGSSVTLRIDTSTGETWRLEIAPVVEWVPVRDHLQAVARYNPAAKKIEWGTKLPDGRDLRDLSKEELIRWVEPILRSSSNTNPKNPLGLFENEPQPQPQK